MEGVIVPLAFFATAAIIVLGLRAMRLKATLRGEASRIEGEGLAEVRTRLDEIERRLTDVAGRDDLSEREVRSLGGREGRILMRGRKVLAPMGSWR